ncbi:MAG: hypothetical protein AABY22_21475, partial [Nanoarchaeota archaeon]
RALIALIENNQNKDGSINWRKMINKESLYPNPQRTKETDIEKIKDEDLLSDLKGLRDLAKLRGYTNVEHFTNFTSQDFVSDTCTITWVPNFETDYKEVKFSAMADASIKNLQGFAQDYPSAISENRAFARAVRNYLNINIVSREELKQDKYMDIPEESVQELSSPSSKLSELMEEKKVSFKKLKENLIQGGLLEAQDYNEVKDIPIPTIFELIEKLSKN